MVGYASEATLHTVTISNYPTGISQSLCFHATSYTAYYYLGPSRVSAHNGRDVRLSAGLGVYVYIRDLHLDTKAEHGKGT